MDHNKKLKMLGEYPELLDVFEIFEHGKKHDTDPNQPNWLTPDGNTMSIKDNFASLNRHCAKYYTGEINDTGSGKDHLLSIMCRSLMAYIRRQRNINHPQDPKTPNHKIYKEQSDCSTMHVTVKSNTLDDSRCLTMEEHFRKVEDINDIYGKRYLKGTTVLKGKVLDANTDYKYSSDKSVKR